MTIRRRGIRVYGVEGGLVADLDEHLTGPDDGSGWHTSTERRGVPGVAPYISLRDLEANPDAVTDWGPVINAAVASGVKHFVDPDPGFDYPFTTPLNFDNTVGVIVEGAGGMPWAGAVPALQGARTRFIYKGTGSGAPVSAVTSSGFTLREIGVYYDNAAFTGKLIDLGGTSCVAMLDKVHGASLPLDHSIQTAHAIVGCDGAVCPTIRDCGLSDAEWIVLGKTSAFSNVVRIEGGVLSYATIALLGNIWQGWVIDGVTFEVETTPAVIDSTGGITGAQFTFSNNWVGDIDAISGSTARPMFKQHATDYWYATFHGNTMFPVDAPPFQLLGGGAINIVNNPALERNDRGALVDLGDTSAGALAKYSFTYRGNAGVCTAADAILHRIGHRNLNIDSNTAGGGVLEVRTLSGHERVGHPDRRVVPTVVDGAGASNDKAILLESSSDVAGIIKVYPQSAGRVARVTFGVPLTPDPEGPVTRHLPCIQITPLEINGGFDGAAGAASQPYVKVNETTQLDADGRALAFDICTKNALATVTCFAYRVIQL